MVTDLHVAFFRALNLGHPRCPSRTQLESAFTDAGAPTAHSVQTNGTVVFAPGGHDVDRLVDAASEALLAECGFDQPVLVRPAGWVAEVLDTFPAYDLPGEFRSCVTLHDAPAAPPVEVPWTSRTGDLVLLSTGPGHTTSAVRSTGGAGADPNSTLEKLLGVPATTRVTTTLERVRRTIDGLAC